MVVKLFSIDETGEIGKKYAYGYEFVSINYLVSVREEFIPCIFEKISLKIPDCFNGCGYIDINRKDKFLELKNAQEISNAKIIEYYYEVVPTEDIKKLFPEIKKFYISDHDKYKICSK